jgi:hypothetical protein
MEKAVYRDARRSSLPTPNGGTAEFGAGFPHTRR